MVSRLLGLPFLRVAAELEDAFDPITDGAANKEAEKLVKALRRRLQELKGKGAHVKLETDSHIVHTLEGAQCLEDVLEADIKSAYPSVLAAFNPNKRIKALYYAKKQEPKTEATKKWMNRLYGQLYNKKYRPIVIYTMLFVKVIIVQLYDYLNAFAARTDAVFTSRSRLRPELAF